MREVELLARGEHKIYTQNQHGEDLFPAIVVVSDKERITIQGARIGLGFIREDGTYYLTPWATPHHVRIVQCYRALKLLEHVSRIQEDTLWGAYMFCDRHLEERSTLAKAQKSEPGMAVKEAGAFERYTLAIAETKIKDPLALRKELIKNTKIEDDVFTRILGKVISYDICPDFNEIAEERQLGTIGDVPELELLKSKYPSELPVLQAPV